MTDLAGISLAAIQALERKVSLLEAENRRLAERIGAGTTDGVVTSCTAEVVTDRH